MTYGKKVMTIGGVRVTDAKSPDTGSPCRGCVFMKRKCRIGFDAPSIETDIFGGDCIAREVIYIPAPDDLKEEA